MKTLALIAVISILVPSTASAGPPPGDANGDYNVDLADVIASLQVAAGLKPAGIEPAGDVNGDGRIGIADAVYILQVAAGRRASIPFNLFVAGDSISEAEAAEDDIGNPHHESVWSTGYASNYEPGCLSLNERFSSRYPAVFEANGAAKDLVFNKAQSGAVMADFYDQVKGTDTVKGVIATAEEDTAAGKLGLITIMLGSNDVCAPMPELVVNPTDPTLNMTSTIDFEESFKLGLDALVDSPATKNAHINVMGIPAIYWLWVAKRSDWLCRLIWIGVPCENLLANSGTNDCDPNPVPTDPSVVSHLTPDTIYDGDGDNCRRRKNFHQSIRDYNGILATLVSEYRADGRLPNIYYTDIYDIQFGDSHVNNGDCFHPSLAGQALLADETWRRSPWGQGDQACQPD